MEIVYSVLIGYFIGSIPTAYIVIKLHSGDDIRKIGSGNVGTLNSYEVTNSKIVGIIVLIIDLLKGIITVFLVEYLINDRFLCLIISLNSAVFGHCYSIWLKFKGGRGLATAAGGALLISPLILMFWLSMWYIFKKLKKDIHIANVAATMGIIIICILFFESLNKFTFPPASNNFIFTFYLSLLMLIIISKHIEPLYGMIRKKNRGGNYE